MKSPRGDTQGLTPSASAPTDRKAVVNALSVLEQSRTVSDDYARFTLSLGWREFAESLHCEVVSHE